MPALPRFRPVSARDLRWTSGLVLMGYVCSHLLNHALGLVSLQAAESVLAVARALWHSAPGTTLLYGAALTHVGLALAALWGRHSLRMPLIDALRIALGLSLPLLLASHLSAMRWGHQMYGLPGSYLRVVGGLWGSEGALLQVAMLLAAWLHGCLGLHLGLRVRAGYARAFPVLLAVGVLLPALAIAGFAAMGREIAWSGAAAGPHDQGAALDLAAERLRLAYGLLLALLAAGWALRAAWSLRRRAGSVQLDYPQGPVQVPRGWSVLEASLAHGVPHLSLCGGRARCSTCRVRVRGPAAHLPAPQADEARTLARVRAPQGVRLACQLRPTGDIEVVPLMTPAGTSALQRLGQERDVAVLFVDLRRWSGLSEQQWPFDLVYVLDRYFARVGAAVREAGGEPNQFIGDSVMAIFGLESELDVACAQALDAARRIDRALSIWSRGFEVEFGQRLDYGMGLHAGRAAVGEVGYLETTSFTAVGEVVNTASRLQDHSKQAQARLVLSRFAAEQAGLRVQAQQLETVAVRGRTEVLEVLALDAGQLQRTG
ncbi:adenylate/guanylate cyclase domain-containing protein [Xenophilus arseniciresistens]|uniref:Adenylate/guanylate cyclase domain-containing protein n=1 Tax=Xenophilus arseniciresistens TaxID=1283306 RepID=A0AAE3N7N2_9BURK|nr:adenylate/guanylate cyclase domain-containing protein [Xenophilus arseniciresistens]MDA7415407.1 adenylate/guanylate cyclase domain-containing protein [Xenophilus arseniciresistens]